MTFIRFVSRSQRQITTPSTHEVPYARLIDSPNKKLQPMAPGKTSTPQHDSEGKYAVNRSLRMPTPKSSVSESKLTVDYFQKSDISVRAKINASVTAL